MPFFPFFIISSNIYSWYESLFLLFSLFSLLLTSCWHWLWSWISLFIYLLIYLINNYFKKCIMFFLTFICRYLRVPNNFANSHYTLRFFKIIMFYLINLVSMVSQFFLVLAFQIYFGPMKGFVVMASQWIKKNWIGNSGFAYLCKLI